jgi:diaminopimelate decarboxylase
MSPGEIYIEEAAGFTADKILYISNNVSAEEMAYAVKKDIMTSVDSLSQLELFGKNFPGKKVAVRFNSGVGAGASCQSYNRREKNKIWYTGRFCFSGQNDCIKI